ncbi:hypothetical protein TIFTF001_018957 [Ficus carica]|uniref:Uncharacterized protein n=1 Tax=Ficus carica TaxID=3494 RepID=A0AA88ASE5_FICCA|nr:hypothetical protein TIFTF001_018957 [Ficus carica]
MPPPASSSTGVISLSPVPAHAENARPMHPERSGRDILSGKMNNLFYQSHGAGDLLSFAWELWREGTLLELLDPTIRSSFSRNEAMRCIHMGLLCVQENPALRPTMATIVMMLNRYWVTLPAPQQPALLHRNRTQSSIATKDQESVQSTIKLISYSVNDGSMITEVYPR